MTTAKGKVREIVKLYRTGYGIRKISKFLNIPKSTVYSYTRSRFGKKIKPVSFNSHLEKELGEIIGAFIGDGSFSFDKKRYAYFIRFYLSGKEIKYAETLANYIKKVFGKKCRINRDKNKDVIILAFESKTIYNIIKKYVIWTGKKSHTVHLKYPLSLYSKNFLRNIISGLIDTDGCVSPSTKRIWFTTVSPKLGKQVVDLLRKFEIKGRIYSYRFSVNNYFRKYKPGSVSRPFYYEVGISGKQNLLKFKDKIGLTEQTKRLKLNNLIASYITQE
jgi:hypothetical protein